jgi:DNA processing protein
VPEISRSPDDRTRRALALALADGIGDTALRDLLQRFGTASAAFDAEVTGARRDVALERAESALADARAAGAIVIAQHDPSYPPGLAALPVPPPALFAIGNPELMRGPAVAIVGTRQASPYGTRTAQRIATGLVGAGAAVVSGMALGIDAAAHLAALAAGGATIAVLASGVDRAYPPSHRQLHAQIARSGLLLSEAVPGAHPHKGSFPRRNRIIAALAAATVVIEAPVRSGALITAGIALDLGRGVGATPGPIDAPTFAGSNALLRDGAAVIASVDDALALAGLMAAGASAPPRLALTADEAAVFDAVTMRARPADDVVLATALPPARCAAALGALEVAGLIEITPAGEFRRVD